MLPYERMLLRKIGILAEHHARNIGALRRLRNVSRAPKTAWGAPTDPPPRCEKAIAINTTIPELSKKGNSKTSNTPSRTFTRVITTSRSRRHNPVPTVVKPFRGMETHTTAWKRKNREYEELELERKKEIEKAKIKDRERFVSAINAGRAFTGVIARSNDMVERRRKQQLEAEQHEEEDRQRHEFKARPLHIADEDWQTIQGRQAVRRKQRVQLRKEMMSSISHLPRRMAMHAQKQRANPAVATGTASSFSESESHTRVRSVSPEKIRLILSRRQKRWDAQLAAAKKIKKPVIPEVLPMEEREKVYRQRAQERAQREQAQSSSACQSKRTNETRRKKNRKNSAAPVVPGTTANFQMKISQVRAKREKESDDLRREKRKETARHVLEQVTSKRLAQVMARIDRQQGRLARRDTAEEAHERASESRARYRNALAENRQKLEQATQDAPTLWERHDAELRKETTKRIALRQVAERVFGTGHGNWDRKTDAEKIFDEEERAMLRLPT